MNIKGKKICFLGDSITEGWGASHPSKCFVGLFQECNKETNVKNFGIWGTRIARQKTQSDPVCLDRDFLSRIDDIDADADVIVVFGGTNDYCHGDAEFGTLGDKTPWTFYGALEMLYQGLIDRCPDAKIIVLTPLHRDDEQEPNRHNKKKILEDYVRAIKEVANKYNLLVFDLFNESGIDANEKDTNKQYLTDGLHPNDKGHHKLFEILNGYITNQTI